MPPRSDTRTVDGAIAAIAGRQHGVVTAAHLLAIGLSRGSIRDRLRAGRLHRIHAGVYAVGHVALGNEGEWMAAVLACGERAMLSHRSAAELLGLLRVAGGPIHITTCGEVRHRRRGVTAHRSRTLLPSQVVRSDGIPVTNAPRTLEDLRRAAPRAEFRSALREAEFRGLPVGDAAGDRAGTELEIAMLDLCRRHGLSMPLVRVEVGRYEVDFLWPDERLIVETDGWQAHRGRVAFELDRERDLFLKLRGYEVVRLTWRQVTKRPEEVAAALRALLVHRASAAP